MFDDSFIDNFLNCFNSTTELKLELPSIVDEDPKVSFFKTPLQKNGDALLE